MRGKLLAVVALFALLAGTIQAHASNKVRCEVMTIAASNNNKGIDPALTEYATVFKQKPFSRFDTFKLVHRQVYEMPFQAPVPLSLPASLGGSMKLSQKNGSQLDLTLSLVRKGQNPINIQGLARPGTPFFAAGLKNTDGVWVFGVACNRDEIVVH